MAVQGGPASNVVVDPSRARAGGPALPVAVVTDGRATEGNNAIAVYEAPAGTPVIAGPALPIVVAPAGSRVEAGPAIPVRVVAGSLGSTVAPPVNTVAPTISGTAELGATLTGNHGTYTGSPTSYTYRWLRNGVAIGGATAQTYVLVLSDLGTTITFEEVPTGPGGTGAAATSAGTAIPNWLLLDRFTTNAAAPLSSPRTCEPGPGTSAAINDPTNKLSITNQALTFASPAAPAFGNPGIWYTQQARAAGMAVSAAVTTPVTRNGFVGWDADTAGLPDSASAFWIRTNIDAHDDSYTVAGVAAINNQVYQCTVVLRSTGAFYLVDSTLVWVGASLSANFYPCAVAGNGNNNFVVDNMAVVQLGAPWNTDYGIATQQLSGARSQGDSFTHTADGFVEWTQTTRASANYTEVRFRKQDATNYWSVQIDSTGAVTLFEVVAGTPTSRGTGSGVTSGQRMVILFFGTTIRVFRSGNNQIISYTSATNFQTATAGDVNAIGTGGAISNIVSWPRTVTPPI